MNALDAFAAEVGARDPVVAVGGRHQWHLGGGPAPATREVRAPAGVVAYEPAEMTITVGAGTTLAELDAATAEAGQMVVLDGPPAATVGGLLAVGRSGLRRLRYGPIRDTVLAIRYVGHDGRLVTAGGPTVKNVTGYDLPRLLVGSLGTLGLFGEVVLRTRPRPAAGAWMTGPADPGEVLGRLYRPVAVLWDGTDCTVRLEGHPADVDAECAVLASMGLAPTEEPPPLPPHRSSHDPAQLARVCTPTLGSFLAELGVGIVHSSEPAPVHPPDPVVIELCRRAKEAFDPAGRLAPGRDVLAATVSSTGEARWT